MSRLTVGCPVCKRRVPVPYPMNLAEDCPHLLGACPRCQTELQLELEPVADAKYRIPSVRERTRSRLSSGHEPDRASITTGASGLGPDRAFRSAPEPDRARHGAYH